MKPVPVQLQEWATHRERGSATAIRIMVAIAMTFGRRLTQLLLFPLCVYFLIFSNGARQNSRTYLLRALSREPRLIDQFRHFYAFATVILDRVYLLNEQIDSFDLSIEGEELLISAMEQGNGCMLFGAHLGSFEVLRALSRKHPALRVSFVMYEENARKINAALNAINPNMALDVIALGQPNSMIEIAQCLDSGGFVGVLADRSLNHEAQERCDFLGEKAPFPLGPFRMAALLKRPVFFMVGLYRGGARYDIHFECLFDPSGLSAGQRQGASHAALSRYVERLEHYCKLAPYNWFNFYDFWTHSNDLASPTDDIHSGSHRRLPDPGNSAGGR